MNNEQLTPLSDDTLAQVTGGGPLADLLGNIGEAVETTIESTIDFAKGLIGTWIGIFD